MSEGQFSPKFDSRPYRAHKDAVEAHVSEIERSFDSNPESFRLMFDHMDLDALTPAEFADLRNFILHAAKRTSVGSLSLAKHQDAIKQGVVEPAFVGGAPLNLACHDAKHAALAYVRTKHASLMPAYELLYAVPEHERPSEDLVKFANLEEASVDLLEHYLKRVRATIRHALFPGSPAPSLDGERYEETRIPPDAREEMAALKASDPALWAFRLWEFDTFPKPAQPYAEEHRSPELVQIVRNLYEEVKSGTEDANFTPHQFLRLIEPLAKRLRSEKSLTRATEVLRDFQHKKKEKVS